MKPYEKARYAALVLYPTAGRYAARQWALKNGVSGLYTTALILSAMGRAGL